MGFEHGDKKIIHTSLIEAERITSVPLDDTIYLGLGLFFSQWIKEVSVKNFSLP